MSCPVATGVGDIARRAYRERYTSRAATWSRPGCEADSPRARRFLSPSGAVNRIGDAS